VKTRAAIIAIIVASTGAFLVWMYLQRFEAEASGGPKIGVLMALKTVEPGSVLKDEDIGERYIPQAYVESRAIRTSDRARVANLRTAAPLQAQQSIMWTDIVGQNGGAGSLSALVQDGMRAVTIKTESRAQSLVRPGDRVDVVATMTQPGSNNDTRSGVVLLQNVLVLGRSVDSTPIQAQGQEGSDVVLSVTLQQAQILAVAGDKAKLSVALRAPDDVKRQDGLSDITSTSLADPALRPTARAAKTGPVQFGTPATGNRL
jgi:pilus assembly protein CpaB